MITIYSTKQCPRCKLLAAAFQKAGIEYMESKLNAAIISDCLTDTDEWVTSAPLVKDGHVWHFASDLFDASGNLKSNWLVELKGVRPHKEFGGIGGQPQKEEQECSQIWGAK
jgi:hypothetical protein